MSAGRPEHDLSILLVEDSALLVERLQEMLTGIVGTRVAAVAGGEAEAVRALAAIAVDVVLVDLHLKQGTGFGVLRAISRQARRPVVIVFTNYDLADYRRAATELGAEYFLDKGRDMDSLPMIIQDIRTRKGN